MNFQEIASFVREKPESNESKFKALAQQWESETRAMSSLTEIAMHPAYQKIIGMGKPAISLILRELERRLNHWFWALEAITGVDPVPPESVGKIREMATIWLRWGREQGYAR
jgi:hypothetical protein